MISPMTLRARLLGMAKPMPSEPPFWPAELKIPVLMPISSPRAFTSAPPEFPRLIAASVWMKSSYSEKPRFFRPRPLMIPSDTLLLNW